MKIANTTALVTGANRGIGKALVEALLAGGATKVYATARNAAQLRFNDDRVVPLTLDVTDSASSAALTGAAPDVDLLINNAGALHFTSITEGDLGEIEHDLNVNYFGVIRVTRALLPALKTNKGTIVNLGSVVSFASMPAIGGYSASKAAVHSLTLALRGELAKHLIAVHGVYPGPIDTDMAKDLPMDKASVSDTAAAILAGIEAGETHIAPDPMAQEVVSTWKTNPKAIEEQFGAMAG